MTTFYSTPDNVSTTTIGYAAGSGAIALTAGTGSRFGSSFPLLVSTFLADGTPKGIYSVSGRTGDILTGVALVAGSDATLPAGSFVEVRWTAEHVAQHTSAIAALESSLSGLGSASSHPATDFAAAADLSTLAASLLQHTTDATNPHRVTKTQIGLGNVDNTSDLSKPISTAQAAGLAAKVHTHIAADVTDFATAADARVNAARGAANGVASLDSTGKVPTAQMPPQHLGQTFVVASQSAMLALAATQGDIAVRSDVSQNYILNGSDPSVLSNWVQLLTPGSPVQSVNGQTGSITLTTTNVAEGSNLYFTTGRASAAAPVQTVAGRSGAVTLSNTDISGLGSAALVATTAFDAAGAAATVQTNLSTHTGNVGNPHSTTAAQVGAYTTAQADTLLAAKLGTTGDGSAVTVTATGESSARSLAAHLADALDVRGFGVVGNGTTDDTAALQSAINAAATAGKWLRAWPGAAFKVSSQGTQTYLGPTGGASSHKIALKIPTGSRIDFMGAKIQGDTTNLDTVLLGNLHTDGSSTDVVDIRNLVVDGGGRATYGNAGARSEVMAWFRGVDRSRFENITVQNTSFIAGSITAFTNTYCHLLNAKNITGQGWVVGGNTADAFFDCTFGTLLSEDIAQFNPGATSGQPGFSQPGNGHFLSGRRWAADMVATRNASGFKIGPGNQDVTIGRVVADGTVNSGESNNGNDNSGCKVQGDPPVVTGTATASGTNALTAVTTVNGSGTAYAVGQFLYGPQIPAGTTITAVGSGTLTLSATVPAGTGLQISASTSQPPDRVSIAQVSSRNLYGYGLYLFDSGHVEIGQFLGYKNGRGGTDADVAITRVANLEIGTLASEWAGADGVDYGPGNGLIKIGQCRIANPGDVVMSAAVDGITPASGDTWIGDLEILDTRSTPIGFQAVNALSDNVFDVKSFRSNVNAPCRIQYPRHRLGNPYLSVGTNPNWGVVTLTGGSATTNIANAHVKTFDYSGSGSANPYVQPIIEVVPWNAAAQSFGRLSYYVPSNFNLTLKHPGGQLAGGTEQYLWRLVEYHASTVQLSATSPAPARVAALQSTATRTARTPLSGELVLDTTTGVLYVGDGSTPGGLAVSAGGGGAVSSVFGRSGSVVATTGDYAVAQVTGAAPLASPTFTGTPAAPTPSAGTNTTQLATTAYVRSEIAALVNSAPSILDTLGEIATQLQSDESTAAALATTVAGKLATASNLSDVPSASTARTNLGLAIGTNVQAWDADLDGLAALATTGFVKRTGAGAFAAASIAAGDLPASVSTVLYKQMADGSVTTTTTETTLVNATGAVGSNVISGLAAGDSIDIECGGTLTSNATPGSLQVKVKFGSMVLDSTSVALTASMTGMSWHARATFVNRTVGASGSVAGQGEHLRATSTVAGMSAYVLKGTTPSTVANNAGVTVDITATFSTSVANTITMAYCTITKK